VLFELKAREPPRLNPVKLRCQVKRGLRSPGYNRCTKCPRREDARNRRAADGLARSLRPQTTREGEKGREGWRVARSFKCHFQSPVFRRGCPRIGQLPITGKARAVINARVIADLRVSVTFAETGGLFRASLAEISGPQMPR